MTLQVPKVALFDLLLHQKSVDHKSLADVQALPWELSQITRPIRRHQGDGQKASNLAKLYLPKASKILRGQAAPPTMAVLR